MLSGHGKDDPVQWDFMCNGGMKAGKWSTIGVPSNWELQGFGVYEYGRPVPKDGWSKVQGKYKRTFTPPAGWGGLKVFIVFEGVMTDTQVFVNGTSAGPMHQGGYYQFRYDVTKLLKFGQENLLEVTVDDESANASINSAERRGDYWNYSGIFRPVYLQADPKQSIDRAAIDAKADGTFAADVYLNGIAPGDPTPWSVEARVMDAAGAPVGAAFSQPRGAAGDSVHLTAKFDSPRLWNAEQPNLYQVEFRLKDAAGVVHSTRQKFGFRTIEVRPGEGLFVNGSRIMLRGCDRHCFWPDSGRCLSEQLSRDDIRLMKDMNMNAVRCSHYPPDIHFLDAADEMGMYVLDELGGWHAKYDDNSGHRLVGEMVRRDVNHPSVLFWDNGNEGGWNTNLDDDFDKWDPQQRHVLHPQQLFRGINNKHYPNYGTVAQLCAARDPFFPTEMLHANYDGGGGAGLEDYWNVMLKSKVSAGGFIWAYLDEDVKRVDLGGKLDSWTNMAPDGIVGPYREKEGSFFTIKQVWCPIAVTRNDDGSFTLENHYAFLDARQCSYTWERRSYGKPTADAPGTKVVWIIKGTVPDSVPPGKSGRLAAPEIDPKAAGDAGDALALIVKDPDGHELWTYVWPEKQLNGYRAWATAPSGAKVNSADSPDTITATVGGLSLQFNKSTGKLAGATRGGKPFSLSNGPRLVTGDAKLTGFTQSADGNDLVLTATYSGNSNSVTYRIHPSGWLTIDYAYNLTGAHDFFGVGFDYPESNVKGMRYLGNGPAPVYKNRLAGGMLDVWDKQYNDTVVGDPDDLAPGAHFDYPPFKGYYAGVRWVQFRTTEGPITALVNQDDLFVQVFAPKVPSIVSQTTKAWVKYPNANISFLHAIPAIGSKNVSAGSSGPMGQTPVASGDYQGSISLYFGEVPANLSSVKGDLPTVTVHLAGDSTVMTYAATTAQEGWGQELGQFFNDKVTIDNKAIGGANVRSFKSGNWSKIMAALQPGDYVMMQFGANDSGTAHGPVTPADFAATLGQMAGEVTARKATPIFVTPSAFYQWSAGKQDNVRLAPYAAAMIAQGAAMNVGVDDLNARAVEYLNSIGQTAATPLYLPSRGTVDKAHFVKAGASRMARLVAEELRRINSPLAAYVK